MHISGETYVSMPAGRVVLLLKICAHLGLGHVEARAGTLCDRTMAGWPAMQGRPELQALFDTRDERAYLMSTFEQQAALWADVGLRLVVHVHDHTGCRSTLL